MQDTSKHLIKWIVLFMPVFLLTAIIIALNLTSPVAAGPAGILVVFFLFYCFAVSSVYLLLRVVLIASKVVSKRMIIGKRLSFYISSVVALGPVFLIALNTLGQIGLIEIVLVVVLIGLGCFYVVRREAN